VLEEIFKFVSNGVNFEEMLIYRGLIIVVWPGITAAINGSGVTWQGTDWLFGSNGDDSVHNLMAS
jgi:hypothetical protein